MSFSSNAEADDGLHAATIQSNEFPFTHNYMPLAIRKSIEHCVFLFNAPFNYSPAPFMLK